MFQPLLFALFQLGQITPGKSWITLILKKLLDVIKFQKDFLLDVIKFHKEFFASQAQC